MSDPAPVRRRPQQQPRPGVAEVRLIGPPDVLDAAVAAMAAQFGDAWQPGTRKGSRHGDGQELQYGTLIVPVDASRG